MEKFFKFLLFIIIPLAFTACDTDSNAVDDDDIVGTWVGTMDCSEGYNDVWSEKWTLKLKSNGSFTLDEEGLDTDENDYYQIYGSYSYSSDNERLRLIVKGDNEYGDLDEDDYESTSFSCSISGNKMKLRYTEYDYSISGVLNRK